MKTILLSRILCLMLAIGLCASSVSCTTTYDRGGRPVQSVDPGAAVVGIVAAGIIGYALANGSDSKDNYSSSYCEHHSRYDCYDYCY